MGKTIKLHRDDVDYPNGRWCVADVRRYSKTQKKYLLAYHGRGHAWLPPGWLELKEKRKAQIVTVATVEVRDYCDCSRRSLPTALPACTDMNTSSDARLCEPGDWIFSGG